MWRVPALARLVGVCAICCVRAARSLSVGEQRLLFETDDTFLSSGEARKAAYMLWVRFALKAPPELFTSEFAGLQRQLDAFSNGGPLQPAFVGLLKKVYQQIQGGQAHESGMPTLPPCSLFHYCRLRGLLPYAGPGVASTFS